MTKKKRNIFDGADDTIETQLFKLYDNFQQTKDYLREEKELKIDQQGPEETIKQMKKQMKEQVNSLLAIQENQQLKW